MVENSANSVLQQRQTILPDSRVRRIHQHFVEEQIDLGPQARDHVFDGLAGDAAELLVEIALRAGFEQRFDRRRRRR